MQAENGSVIKKTESYLVNALSFTEAEARLQSILEQHVPEYELKSCAKINMTDAVFTEDAERWYKSEIVYTSHDEDSGKEKKIKETFFVACNSIDNVLSILEDRLEGSVVDWETVGVSLTDVLDVFPYEDTADHEQVSE